MIPTKPQIFKHEGEWCVSYGYYAVSPQLQVCPRIISASFANWIDAYVWAALHHTLDASNNCPYNGACPHFASLSPADKAVYDMHKVFTP